MSLEYKALSWLRREKNCPFALFERTPRAMGGQPDVLGVTRAGYLLEIEIKRSMSDFYANANKAHIRRREDLEIGRIKESEGWGDYWTLKKFPKQFWFLVPTKLAESVASSCKLPKWAGVLTEDGYYIKCVKESPINELSEKLTPREMIKLGNNMSNQIWSQARKIEELIGNKCEHHLDDYMALLI